LADQLHVKTMRTPLVAICSSLLVIVSAGSAHAASASSKVDHAVRASQRTGAATERVIITLEPGCRAGIRLALEQHGDAIISEHPLIEALSGEIHSGDVDDLAKQPCVRAISSDA